MKWQDVVFSVGSVLFTIALIPSLMSNSKPSVHTSLITSVVLSVFTATYLSLALVVSCWLTALNSLCWLILAIQKIRMSRNILKTKYSSSSVELSFDENNEAHDGDWTFKYHG